MTQLPFARANVYVYMRENARDVYDRGMFVQTRVSPIGRIRYVAILQCLRDSLRSLMRYNPRPMHTNVSIPVMCNVVYVTR